MHRKSLARAGQGSLTPAQTGLFIVHRKSLARAERGEFTPAKKISCEKRAQRLIMGGGRRRGRGVARVNAWSTYSTDLGRHRRRRGWLGNRFPRGCSLLTRLKKTR